MNKPKTTDCHPTYVERLDRIVDGYYGDSEDYKVLRTLLGMIDSGDILLTTGMMSAEEIRMHRELDEEALDDYSDLREPMR